MDRRKIEMKLVRDSNSRQVTFSKRKKGLFKKASDLETLCAVQLALVVFSPGGKPFSFGHSSVDTVSQCFENEELKLKLLVDDPKQEGVGVHELNKELNDLLMQLKIKQKCTKDLNKAIKANLSTCKYKKPINELNMDELLNLKTTLEELRENLKYRVRENNEASSSLLLLNKATQTSDN